MALTIAKSGADDSEQQPLGTLGHNEHLRQPAEVRATFSKHSPAVFDQARPVY